MLGLADRDLAPTELLAVIFCGLASLALWTWMLRLLLRT